MTWEQVADPEGLAQHTLGTTAIYYLLYMDDLKAYAGTPERLTQLIKIVELAFFTRDIR
jgi:hypothetical protein